MEKMSALVLFMTIVSSGHLPISKTNSGQGCQIQNVGSLFIHTMMGSYTQKLL
jgi:hypothetical protein